jgi:hypothetical protein
MGRVASSPITLFRYVRGADVKLHIFQTKHFKGVIYPYSAGKAAEAV